MVKQLSPQKLFIFFITFIAIINEVTCQVNIVNCDDLYDGQSEIVARSCIKLNPGFKGLLGCNINAWIDPTLTLDQLNYNPSGNDIIVNPEGDLSRNYIRTTTYKIAVNNENYLNSAANIVDIEYFDGLNRSVQKVAVKASPDFKDIVQVASYDNCNRLKKAFLPYASVESNGNFKQSADLACISFYKQTNAPVIGRLPDDNPYRTHYYENSPLSRPTGDVVEGKDWLSHPTIVRYNTNLENVTTWVINDSGSFELDHYIKESLSVVEEVDEDNNSILNYYDRLGLKVLVEKKQAGGSSIKTSYIYDKFGLLRCVISPKNHDNGPSYENSYYYNYDSRRRLIEKKLPGLDWEYYIYDIRDRLVMWQDAVNRSNGEWHYQLYDVFNRPVVSGLMTCKLSCATLRLAFADFNGVSFETFGGGTLFGYSNESFPVLIRPSNESVLSVIYYDYYAFKDLYSGGYGFPNIPEGGSIDTHFLLENKGTITGKLDFSSVRDSLLTVYYYDNHYRLLCEIKDNHLSGQNCTFYKYNFTDQIIERIETHNSIYQSDITLRYNYLYDHVGRPLSVKLSVNNAKSTVLQAIEYNEVGDAVNTYFHNANPNVEGSGFCQKVKHEYNIRGWLSRINNVNNIGFDLFALDIKYQDPQLTNGLYTEKSYSGNISQLTYNLRNKTKFGYGFKYDDFDRLLNSNYAEGSNLDENVGKNNSNYSYDENGNIIYLQRFRSNTLIDRLYLNYGNGNMLKTVHDDGSVDGFIPTSGQFLYDLNGSLIYDPSKKISITNNFLNLPINIEFSPEDKISYGYSSVGVKEFKQVTSWHGANSLSVVDYCGSFVYKDKVLNCILTPFGRLVSVIVDSVNIWKTEYNLTDHLGNIGVVFAGHSSGQPEVMQQTTYYPFGYTLEQSNYYSLWSEMNKNLYNGKELQDDELGGVRLDWYDYGARFYDPQIGRWNSVDRFAEKYASLTPYHYAANNPIYYIDINGDSLWITHNTGFLGLGGTQTLLYENGNLYNKDGTAYTGKVKGFLSKSVNALNIISGTQEGGSMVGELQSSANNFTLVKGDNKFTPRNINNAYANQIQTDPEQAGTFQSIQNAGVNLAGGSGGTISWNPSGEILPILNGSGVNGTTDLAHEMFHGLDANRGLLDDRSDQGIERSEWQAVYRENVLRSQLGSPLRTHYIIAKDVNGIFLGGLGPRMLTPANQPILPNWYTP